MAKIKIQVLTDTNCIFNIQKFFKNFKMFFINFIFLNFLNYFFFRETQNTLKLKSSCDELVIVKLF